MLSGNSISVSPFKPKPLLEKYIKKVFLFQSKNTFEHWQKLTPSAFMYLTNHRRDIPLNIIGSKVFI
jgi:hypothetical protein